MIITNASPLIAIGRLDRFDILKALFGQVYIPNAVYQETVVETTLKGQRNAILAAIEVKIIVVIEPTTIEHPFKRKLDPGEKAVLSLAIEQEVSGIIIDDRKARNEANELGSELILLYTTDILKAAEKRGLLSYKDAMQQLRTMKIYLPE